MFSARFVTLQGVCRHTAFGPERPCCSAAPLRGASEPYSNAGIVQYMDTPNNVQETHVEKLVPRRIKIWQQKRSVDFMYWVYI